MKKLGVMEEEDRSTDDMLLDYFKLFGGSLSGPVIKASTAYVHSWGLIWYPCRNVILTSYVGM